MTPEHLIPRRTEPSYDSRDEPTKPSPKSYSRKHLVSAHDAPLLTVLIQTVGLLVGSMIAARLVVNCQLDPRDFLFFIAYLAHVSPRIWGNPITIFDTTVAL